MDNKALGRGSKEDFKNLGLESGSLDFKSCLYSLLTSLISFFSCKMEIQHYLFKGLLIGINERTHAKHKAIAQNRALIEF